VYGTLLDSLYHATKTYGGAELKLHVFIFTLWPVPLGSHCAIIHSQRIEVITDVSSMRFGVFTAMKMWVVVFWL
jgi:hypothetical protein